MEKENILYSRNNLPINIFHGNIEHGKEYRDLHFHKDVEIVKINKGKIGCDVAGEEITLGEENYLVISPGTIHKLYYYEECAEITYLQIDIENSLKSFISKKDAAKFLFFIGISSKPYIFFDKNSSLSDIITLTEIEYNKNDEYSDSALSSLIMLITAELCRKSMFVNLGEVKRSKDIASLLPAMEYIENNYKTKITLDCISSALHIDKFNFCKSFKLATGMTFVEYLNLRRLKNAEEMLMQTNLPISEIAFECGFTSIQNFNHFFKKSKGISPISYRKMYY